MNVDVVEVVDMDVVCGCGCGCGCGSGCARACGDVGGDGGLVCMRVEGEDLLEEEEGAGAETRSGADGRGQRKHRPGS